jgi:hypothetical protein
MNPKYNTPKPNNPTPSGTGPIIGTWTVFANIPNIPVDITFPVELGVFDADIIF